VANILTTTEAANVLRTTTDDDLMLDLLPQVDSYIQHATGRDWSSDSTVHPVAKSAARMLLTMWFENPAMTAQGMTSMNHGLMAAMTQLESMALHYHNIEGISGSGYIPISAAKAGDTVSSVTGLIGVSGDQSASFETVISEDGYIKQVSSSDLSDKYFRVYLVPIGEL